MKLTKPEIKAHNEAMALVDADRPLTWTERAFILDNFQEGASHVNSAAGAFFTPRDLARDFSIEVDGGSVIDLCAGIGSLSFALEGKVDRIVCVEINPEYARIGRRVVPSAQWIACSAFDPWLLQLGRFNWAISNPPFGNIKSPDYDGSYTGSNFEYRIIELASRIADLGAFIIPQMSSPFAYSGRRGFDGTEGDKPRKFREQTGIVMEPNCGIDTAIYKDEWRGVSPVCEIVICNFSGESAAKESIAQEDMFGEAA